MGRIDLVGDGPGWTAAERVVSLALGDAPAAEEHENQQPRVRPVLELAEGWAQELVTAVEYHHATGCRAQAVVELRAMKLLEVKTKARTSGYVLFDWHDDGRTCR